MTTKREKETLKEAFAERIRMLVGEHRSANSFAKLCGIPQSLLRKYLAGISLPGLDKLVAISQATGVRLEWLATGTGPMYGPSRQTDASDPPRPPRAQSFETPTQRPPQATPGRVDVDLLLERVTTLEKENALLRAKLRERPRHDPLPGKERSDSDRWIKAWPVLSLIARHYPASMELTEIERVLRQDNSGPTRAQILAVLDHLQKEGVIRKTDDGAFTLASSLVDIKTKDPSHVAQHAAVALRLLTEGVIPAVEKGEGGGYLVTAEMAVARSRKSLPRDIKEAVRKICDEASDDTGSRIRIVLGVELEDENPP